MYRAAIAHLSDKLFWTTVCATRRIETNCDSQLQSASLSKIRLPYPRSSSEWTGRRHRITSYFMLEWRNKSMALKNSNRCTSLLR